VNGPSDAQTMARLFLVPAWFWAGLWMAVSAAMLVWTLRVTRTARSR
jgi:Peptidase M50B-like